MDLANRTVHAPSLAEVPPFQNELPNRNRNAILDVCHFCHDRHYIPIEATCQAGSGSAGPTSQGEKARPLCVFVGRRSVSLVASEPARRIKSRPNRMSPDDPGRAPERSACKCPWLTTAMTISARLISRARSIVVFMVPTIDPRAINL